MRQIAFRSYSHFELQLIGGEKSHPAFLLNKLLFFYSYAISRLHLPTAGRLEMTNSSFQTPKYRGEKSHPAFFY